jgi:WD40 repeat protein/serine/threonine protein kinase
MSAEESTRPPKPPRTRPEELSFSALLRRRYGTGVDPGILLESEATTPTTTTAHGERLEKLAAHAPVSSRYVVRREIARGGMGAILEVWDEDLRRNMAMKVVLGREDDPSQGSSPPVDSEKLSRFLEEAQITGQLDHPGIVPVHDLGIDASGRVYFTMPLIKGLDLKEVFELARTGEGGWTLPRALGVFVKICEAMAFAHSKGVVHRDLKPTNVMVGRFGEAYVMDWGLARVRGREDSHDLRPRVAKASSVSVVRTDRRDDLEADPNSPVITMDGDVVGTPAYMSPEQASGLREKIGPRSDVYCVGAMLYHLLGGQMPYVPPGEKVSPYTVLNAVRNGPPTPLRRIARHTPPELVAITEKAMAREQEERYADMRPLAEDLRAYLEGRVVSAFESGRLARIRKWVGRNKALAAASALSLLLAFGGLSTILGLEVRARREAERRQGELEDLNVQLTSANEEARDNLQIAESARDDAEQEKERADAQALRAQLGELAARRNSYVANVSVADYSLRLNDVEQARARLALCDADLRGWEWEHLRLKSDTSIWVAPHEGRGPRLAAFSEVGESVLAVVGLTALELDVESGTPIGGSGWRSGGRLVSALALSPSREHLAVGAGFPAPGASSAEVQLHDARTGEVLLGLSGNLAFLGTIALSEDGSLIAAGDADRRIVLWSQSDAEPHVLSLGLSAVTALALSPSSELLLAGFADGAIRGWQLRSGEEIEPLQGHESRVTSIAFDATGERCTTASDDRTAKIWDLAGEKKPVLLLGHGDAVSAVRFSPDGDRVATASADRTARVWDAATGQQLSVLRGHVDEVTSIDFHPEGDLLVTSSKDETVRLWDIDWSNAELRLEGHEQRVNDIAFSPNGEHLYTASSDHTVRVWDLQTGEAVSAHREPRDWLGALAVSPDGRLFAAGGREEVVRVWRTADQGVQAEIRVADTPVQALAFHSSGRLLAVGSGSDEIELWDPWTGRQEAVLRGHGRTVTGLAFADDGRRLASVSRDGTLRIWDVARRAEVFRAKHDKGLTGVAFSPGGDVATSGQDGVVRLFDALSSDPVLEMRGHDGWVYDVDFSRDGRRLVSCGADGTVRVWNALSGNELLALTIEAEALATRDGTPKTGPRQLASVRCVAVDPRSRRVAAGTAAVSMQARRGQVRVFETGDSASRVRRRRQTTNLRTLAEPLLTRLFGELPLSTDVIDALRGDSTLDEDLREVAIRMARVGGTSYSGLDISAWEVLSTADSPPERLADALLRARTGYEEDPDDPDVALLFAAAEYRRGQYEEAHEILSFVGVRLEIGARSADRKLVWRLFSALTAAKLGNAREGREHVGRAALELQSVRAQELEQPWMQGLFDEAAIGTAYAGLDLPVWDVLCDASTPADRLAEAIARVAAAREADPHAMGAALLDAVACHRAGDNERARELLALVETRAPRPAGSETQELVPSVRLLGTIIGALVDSRLGDAEAGRAKLRSAIEEYAAIRLRGVEPPHARGLLEEAATALGLEAELGALREQVGEPAAGPEDGTGEESDP